MKYENLICIYATLSEAGFRNKKWENEIKTFKGDINAGEIDDREVELCCKIPRKCDDPLIIQDLENHTYLKIQLTHKKRKRN